MSIPITFDFHYDCQKNILRKNYHKNNEKHIFRICVKNETMNDLKLSKPSLNNNSYHFKLQFKTNFFNRISDTNNRRTKYLNCLNLTLDKWKIIEKINTRDGSLSLYFTYKEEEEYIWSKGEVLNIELAYDNIKAAFNSESTKVMLVYDYISDNQNNFITGNVKRNVEIVDTKKLRNVPLRANFIKGDAILNDYEQEANDNLANKLYVELKNVAEQHDEIISFTQCTELVLLIDVSATAGAFMRADNFEHISYKWVNRQLEELEVKPSSLEKIYDEEKQLVKIRAYNFTEGVKIENNDSLIILIDGIYTNKPSGEVTIPIHYKNIPSYKDGKLKLIAEKTLLIEKSFERNQNNVNNLGIGTMPEEEYRLKVGGNVKIVAEENTSILTITNEEETKAHLEMNHEGDITIDGDVRIKNATQEKLYFGETENVFISNSQGESHKLKLNATGGVEVNQDLKVQRNLKVEGEVDTKGLNVANGKVTMDADLRIKNNSQGKQGKFYFGETEDVFISNSQGESHKLKLNATDGVEVNNGLNVVNGKVKEKMYDLIPAGTIMMWAGYYYNDTLNLKKHGEPTSKPIPEGWVLCDGNNGTPDLINKFIVGAHPEGSSEEEIQNNSDKYKIGAEGGTNKVELSEAEMPLHSHSIEIKKGLNESIMVEIDEDGDKEIKIPFLENISALENMIDIHDSGKGMSHENRPPFYALCYIMKT